MAYVYWLRATHHTNMLEEGYIGYTSKTVDGRFKEHIKAAKSKTQKKHIVHKAILKYEDSLVLTTLVEGSEDYCLMIEEKLRPKDFIGWNQVKGGGVPPSAAGKKQNPEHAIRRNRTIKAMRANETEEDRLARLASYAKWTDESKAKFSDQCKGKKKSAAHIESMRQCRLGKPQSDESNRKRRETMLANPVIIPSWATSNANKKVWSLATDVYNLCAEQPNCYTSYLENALGLARQQLSKIHAKIKSGWNPYEDTAYLEWLAEYNKQKELHESACTT